MLRAHKIRLNPNQAQAEHFARACGVARFSWNWALDQWQKQYQACKADPSLPKPTEGALRRQLNAIKKVEFPWMQEVTKCAPQEAIIALGQAYQNWFKSLSGKRKGPALRAPQFKKKGRNDRFKIHGTLLSIDGSRIRIPKLGWVRMREPLRFAGRVVGATVSRTAHAWHVALLVDTDDQPDRTENQRAVGVDVGISTLATLSTGEQFDGPKALGGLIQRLRRLSRAHSRKVKGSSNRKRSARRLARLHWRIANVRSNALHQLTHRLTRDYAWVAIEDLNVRGMMANGRLARHLADASFGEFRRQLTYKAAQRGVSLAVVDRFYSSSKTCSACGAVNSALTLADRSWQCPACGEHHQRDHNAAVNILAESIRAAQMVSPAKTDQATAGAAGIACGEEGADAHREMLVKPASMKQEVQA